MNHRVEWTRSALDELATLWTTASDRDAVATAADRIDAELERDPDDAGESRAGRLRIMIDSPLAVYFSVDAGSGDVTVWSVWRSRKR